ncbi:MAG: sce7726 family protein [Fibrobacteraceae bacterium]|nr:sce7726 family protein [Fibrobacteraceae bacterium]
MRKGYLNPMSATPPPQNAVCSRIFSSEVMRALAHEGRSSLLGRLIREMPTRVSGNLADVFATAYASLSGVHERNEYIYKNVLTSRILLGVHSLKTTTVVPEFRVGGVKADFAVFNGTSTVYEIKTERDTLRRLQKQLDYYLQLFDKIYVVAGESHLEALLATLPSCVGLISINQRMQRTAVREAASNMENADPDLIFDALRTSEIDHILTTYQLPVPVVPNTLRRKAQYELFRTLTPVQIHRGMVSAIRKYRGMLKLEGFIDSLPSSLKAVGVSFNFSLREQNTFLHSLNTEVHDILAWA